MLSTIFLYLCLLVYLGMFSILYSQYVTLLLFLIFLILPFVLFFHLLYLQTRVQVRFYERMGVVGKNEDIRVMVEVENKSIFPIADMKIRFRFQNAFSDEAKRETIHVSVPGRLSKRRTKEGKRQGNLVEKMLVMASDNCGCIEVSLEGIRVMDYLHITSVKRKAKKRSKTLGDAQVTVTVLPELQEVELEEQGMLAQEDMLSVENDHFSKTKPGDDPSEIFDIREYREGDRIHRLHWKLSSKRNQWMVKEFSLPLSCETAVLLDLYKEDGEEDVCEFMDRILTRALSISHTLLQQGFTHAFVWVDGRDARLYEVRLEHEADFYEMMEALLHARPYGRENENLFMETYQGLHENYDITKCFYVNGD